MFSTITNPWITLEKAVGETPLSCIEAYRAKHAHLCNTKMTYAGRLDPMASGKLLVLLGDECKQQTTYHELDKEYEFSVLFGVKSDTGDVLGRLGYCVIKNQLDENSLRNVTKKLIGDIELPYPHFSSKTVRGKPLHAWALEGRLNEIETPIRQSNIYELQFIKKERLDRNQVANTAQTKINTLSPVTPPRKALGNDFRRTDILSDWKQFEKGATLPTEFTIAHFRCVASSGSYMRSLVNVIAGEVNTCGLAWHIHRTKIGRYDAPSMTWTLLY